MLPQILRITIDLAKKYSIPAIRLPRERIYLDMLRRTGSVSRLLQLFILNAFCRLGRNMPIRRTDYFLGFFFGGHLHTENLQRLLRDLPSTGTCELMCHPGLDDPTTPYNHWRYRWSDELRALIAPEISDALRRKGVQLISYRQLAQR
jgi:predicted glycoside hydrolase/deacetylase ChbG (UPF0249 family)